MTGVDTMTSSSSFGHAMGPNGTPGQGQTQTNSSGQQPAINHITLKAKEEVIASLHLIKDIRRLETYQRDFFLKVKESLNHVQLLLDHQLMDMAWSDSLMSCEESLLKTSVHLATSSPSQLTDLYGHLLQDRDKLSRRFQELSVKSSLSEYVVNSRQLLDIETVHHATEAILRNEKPIQPKGDKSIPVDHTFFLANFCTTSIASSMFASLMPKLRESYQQHQQPHSDAQPARYVGNDTQSKTGVNSTHSSETGGMRQNNPSGNYYANSAASNAHAAMSASNGLYNGEAMDKYMGDAAGEVSKNVFGTHDLVTAISQITRRDEASPTKKDPWTKGEGSVAAPPGLLMTGSNVANASANAYKTGQNGTGPVGHEPVTTTASSQPQQPQAQPQQQQQNDGSSDSATSEPEEYDSSKPLSFARIASLNLEKQRQQMASASNGVNNVNANFVTAAAATPPTRQANAAAALAQQNSFPTLPAASMVAVDNGTASATMPLIQLPPSMNPRYFFDIVMEGKRLGRVVIEVQPAVAPKMAQNFGMLVTGDKGFGYKGCQFFQAWKNESVICGDWEHNSGRGGRSALDGGPLFTPDETRLPCIRGAVGMRRMSKKHSSLNQVASQFRVILANMSSQFTGIFGHVVAGIEALDKVANIGGEGGRPEKVAVVANCGVYKA